MKLRTTILTLALCALGATAGAQDAPALIEPTEEQASLRDLAFTAFKDGDMATAVVMFERSLKIQELNSTWANLGRARWGLGDCAGAVEAFDRAARSPGDATPAEINEILARYRKALPERCGQLMLSCKEPVKVQIDGAEPTECAEDPIWVTTGTHEIVALFEPEAVTRSVDVDGGFVREVILAAPAPEPAVVETPPEEIEPPETKQPEPETTSGTAIVGWSTGAVGAGLLVTVVTLDGIWTTPLFERLESNDDPLRHEALKRDFEDAQSVNQILFYSGVSLVAVGAGFLLVDAFTDGETESAVAPWIGPETVGATIRF